MLREWDMNRVSDGKRYHRDDMVEAGCDDCRGCSDCCQGMGDTIVLDPYDMYRLTSHLKCSAEALMNKQLELTLVDGVALPSLKMSEEGRCFFLNKEGRCDVHSARPGICRLFPLGRIYEENGFSYFLQIHECTKGEHTPVRVSEWLDTPNMKKYEKYIGEWHSFLLAWQRQVHETTDENVKRQTVMYLLMQFFFKSYQATEDFYPQFYARLEEARELIGGQS